MEPDASSLQATKTREPYEPPDLVAIELTADQVLAAGCKSDSGLALGGLPACGPAFPCLAAGS